MPPMATSPTPTSTSTSRITSPTRPPLSCRWYRRFASYARPGLVTMLASPSPPPSPLATRHSPLTTHHSTSTLTRCTSSSRPTSSSCSPSSSAWGSTQPPAAAPAGMAARGWGGCPCLHGWGGWCCALRCSARRSSLGLGFVAGPRAAAGCIGLQPRVPRPAPPVPSPPPGAVTPRVLPGYHPMATGPRGTAAALGRG